MAVAIDFVKMADPVSGEDPCGPDLEAADDPDYMQFMARAEGLLPVSYFAFDRSVVDFDAEIGTIRTFLAGSRDLRLLVLLAKLLILNRDLAGFSACCGSLDTLLRTFWDDIHPRLDDGDAAMRMAVLQSLDDLAPVIFPLQHVPLIHHRRLGSVSYRTYLVASGGAKAREGEDVQDRHAVETAFREADLAELGARRDELKAVQQALAGLRAACVDRVGYEQAVSLDRLPPLVADMARLLDGFIAERDPGAAGAAPAGRAEERPGFLDRIAARFGGAGSGSTGDAAATVGALTSPPVIGSTADAALALAAAAGYFARSEPSSPALLLTRQAEHLIGKSFFEALQALVPALADQAAIALGAEGMTLPLERLSALESSPEEEPAGEDEPGEARERITARTREDALALLYHVAAYFRLAEPSSPIPLLLERALALAERDFLALLRDVLPSTS